MPDEKKDEKFIEVRCNVCNSILFEAGEETSGPIRKKCKGCKKMRTVNLPLQRGAKRNTILSDAAKAA